MKKEEYDFWKWRVPLIQDPDYLETYIEGMDIIGEVVKSVSLLGISFDAEDNLVEYTYRSNQKTDGAWNEDMFFLRWLEIDEPIFIKFESGNRLEIDFSEASSLKIGKNSIGSLVKSYTGRRSEIDPDVMFSLILGQELIRVEIERIAEIAPFDFTGSRGIPEPKGAQFIEGIRFVFANGYQLHVYSELDYGEIELLDEKGEPAKIYWKELKHGVTEEFQIITQQD